MLGAYSCEGEGLAPQVRIANGPWRYLESTLTNCNANVFYPLRLPAHGELVLVRSLVGMSRDVALLARQQQYDLRLTLSPQACLASPDASFCLNSMTALKGVTSNALRVDRPAEPQ